MRREFKALSLGVTAVVVVAVTAVAMRPAAAGTASLENPGFEEGLSGWSCSAVARSVTGQEHSGSKALGAEVSASDHGLCRQTVSIAANTPYTLSAQVEGSYVFLGVSGEDVPSVTTWEAGTGGSYRELSLNFTTGPRAKEVTVSLHGWYGQGTYHADDVALSGRDGTGQTPPPTLSPTDGPKPSSPPSPTVPGKPTATAPAVSPAPTAPTASPAPTDSGVPGPTATSRPSGALAEHALIGYWQNFNNGAKTLRLKDVPAAYDLVDVAFADAVPGRTGAVTFQVDPGLASALGGYTEADLKADVDALHSRGTEVVLSVGGQNGAVSVGDDAAAKNFADSVYAVMREFGFDGIDIDLENGLTPAAMSQALHSLRQKAGSDLIITMAPETLFMQSESSTYLDLALRIKDILTVVHTQYYNSGSMAGCDGKVYSQGSVDFITSQACIALEAGLRPDQVAIGLPASPSAAGSGYVSPDVVGKALTCLSQGKGCGSFTPPKTWPGLRGAMTWSINWDVSAGKGFSDPVSATLESLP
jgi:chitinase